MANEKTPGVAPADPTDDDGGGIGGGDSDPGEGFDGGETGVSDGAPFSASGNDGQNSTQETDPPEPEIALNREATDIFELSDETKETIKTFATLGDGAVQIAEGVEHILESTPAGPVILVPEEVLQTFDPNRPPPHLL